MIFAKHCQTEKITGHTLGEWQIPGGRYLINYVIRINNSTR